MAQPDIALEPMTPAALAAFAQWLRRPHVAPWYPNPDDNLAWAQLTPPGGHHAIISHAGRPVGYIRWQVVERSALDAVGLTEIPANSVDVDILLAEPEDMGRGFGPAALRLLVRELRNQVPTPPLIGLTTSKDNARAHQAFVKAGFHLLRQYEPEGFGACNLFVISLQGDALRHPPAKA